MKKQLTKQELKDKQEKKQRILKFVKRSINIVCYCLSVLFLILCVAVGVQSCNSSKDKTNKLIKRDNNYSLHENINSYTTYYYFDEEVVNGAWQTWQTSADGFNFGSSGSSYSAACRVWGSMKDVGYDHEFKTVLFRYNVSSPSWASTPVIHLTYISLQNFNTGWSTVVYDEDNDIFNNYMFTINGNIGTIENLNNGSITETENGNFLYFWLKSINFSNYKNLDYLFSYDLNYYYMFSSYGYTAKYTNVNTKIYDVVLDSDKFGQNIRYTVYINLPFFISGNQLFNRIRLNYSRVASMVNPNYPDDDVWDTPWWTDDGTHQLLDNTNCGFFTGMTYENTLTDKFVHVYSRDTANLVDNDLEAKPVYWGYTNSCSWTADMYRHILISDGETFNNSDAYVQLASLNYYNNSTQNDVAIYSLFDMFSQAFRSITSLFSISIIPGFTIGVLMFMPFVVLIIVTIIRLVKK